LKQFKKQITNKQQNNPITMKKAIVLFSALFLMTLVAQNVNAQPFTGQKTATSATEATIITPIAITKTIDLNFGNVVSGTGTGTVTVVPAGTRSSAGDVTLPAATPGTITAATFNVTGLANATYSITLPTTLNVVSGANSMVVNGFTSNPTPTGTLSASGAETVTVGATLNVGANQAAGTYTNASDLEITVAYN
jgi:hypothetical protein